MVVLAVVIFLFDSLREMSSVAWLDSQVVHVLKILWHTSGHDTWVEIAGLQLSTAFQ